MSEETPWYYRDGAASQGPFDTEHVRHLLRVGAITSNTPVARQGWSDWRRAGDMFPDVRASSAPSVASAPSTPSTSPAPSTPSAPEARAPVAPEPPRAVARPVERLERFPSTPAEPPKSPRSEPPRAEPNAGEERCIELRCIAGPDAGRSFWVGPGPLRLDRDAGLSDQAIGVLSVEPASGRLHVRVDAGPPLEIDGVSVTDRMLDEGTRFRFGSSTWCVGVHQLKAGDLLSMLSDRLNRLASFDKLEGFSLREMFSEVFAVRTPEEIDEYFLVGTAKTTPSIQDVPTGWPKPWLFARILLFLGLVYFGFFFAFRQFENPKLLPGLILMGSTAVPFATLVLFYELNTPRNVSFRTLLSLFFMGGVLSVFIALLGFEWLDLSWLGASSAGIIEECGKLFTVVVISRAVRHRYILNGLLFGAAVGAGFAGFESAGYAFEMLWASRSFDQTTGLILLRGLLTPFGHVPWTAFAAGALWRVKGERPFSLTMLGNFSFLKAFSIPVALHMLWNAPLTRSNGAAMLICATLGVIGWYVVFGLAQQGLRQVRDEQRSVARRQIETTRMSMRLSIPPDALKRAN